MTVRILKGDCRDVLRSLPAESVHCAVTSPPYWGLRDYGCVGQIGLEATVTEFVDELVAVFRDVRRVLRSDGSLWLNLGDSYATGLVADRLGRNAILIELNPEYAAMAQSRIQRDAGIFAEVVVECGLLL